MSEWVECCLADIAYINPTESLSKGTVAKKIGMDALLPFTKFASRYVLEEYKGGTKFRNKDTLVARITPCLENGKTCYVNLLADDEVGFGSTEYIVLRSKDEKSDSEYLYYFSSSDIFREVAIASMTGSSGRQRVQAEAVINHQFQFPTLPEQKAIASVLSSLDNKIDLLHRQNKTLESMAETLFRQWFIEEAETSWEECLLEQMVESANTGLDAIKRAPIVEYPTNTKCLRIQDISQRKPLSKWGYSSVSEKDYKKAQLKAGDLIMARTCSPGIIYYVREDEKAVFNNGLARIRPNLDKTYSIFLYYLFKSDSFIGHIYGISDGTSVQLNMKIGDLLSYKLKFPPKNKQDLYYPTFKKIDDKLLSNQKQIQTLEKLRDTLLPKLMSGEIRVNY